MKRTLSMLARLVDRGELRDRGDHGDGTVTATGREGAAGIGSGASPSYGIMVGSYTAISGGDITANGGKNAAAIGTGKNRHTKIDITGGSIFANAHPNGGVGIGTAESSLDGTDVTLDYPDDYFTNNSWKSFVIITSSFNANVKLVKPFASLAYHLVPTDRVEDLSMLANAVGPWAADIDSWQNLQAVVNGTSAGSVITLTQDLKSNYGYDMLEIGEGKKLTIDLNGHTLDRNATRASENGSVIINDGELTLTDSVGGGVIRSGNTTGDGGIVNNGTLTIENITITGNSAQGSGGGPGARRRGRRGGPEKEEVSSNERYNYGEVACAPSP